VERQAGIELPHTPAKSEVPRERVSHDRLLDVLRGEFAETLARQGLYGFRLRVARQKPGEDGANWTMVTDPPLPRRLSVTRYVEKRLRHLRRRYDLV
jgi:hypothetical protein